MSRQFDNENVFVGGKVVSTERKYVINVEYLGLIRNVLNCSEEQYSMPLGSTVKALLQRLVERHGEQVGLCILTSEGQLRPMTEIYLDGSEISTRQGLDTPITGEGRVSVVIGVQPFPGG